MPDLHDVAVVFNAMRNPDAWCKRRRGENEEYHVARAVMVALLRDGSTPLTFPHRHKLEVCIDGRKVAEAHYEESSSIVGSLPDQPYTDQLYRGSEGA